MRCMSDDGKKLISEFEGKKAVTILYANPVSPKPVLTKVANGVKVSWTAEPGVTKYRIYRRTADTNWGVLAVATGTEYIDTACELGTEYTYLMRCLSSDGKTLISEYEGKKAVTILYSNPVSPKPVLTKVANGVKVSWTAEPGVTKYRIYRKTADTNWGVLAVATGTEFVDTTCEIGTEYTYLMRCLSSDGKTLISEYEGKKAATILYADPVSPVPVLTKVASGVKVNWETEPGVVKYRIYRKTADT